MISNSRASRRQSPAILLALAGCLALEMTAFVMLLPLFARRFESFGAGVEALGISAMAYALTSTVAAPFGGMLADRTGRRPVIQFSLAALILALFLIHETYSPAAHADHSQSAWMQGLHALPARPTFVVLMLITFGVTFAWAFIEPREILHLTILFDHNIIDGAPAARFTRRLVELIEGGHGLEEAEPLAADVEAQPEQIPEPAPAIRVHNPQASFA